MWDFVAAISAKKTSGVGMVGGLAGLKAVIMVPTQTFDNVI